MLFVDRREITEHKEIPTLLEGVPFTIDTLTAGDYAFLDIHGEPQGIERCKVANLIQKLRSGELEEQLTRCAQIYTKTSVLIEDVNDEVHGFLALYRKTDRGYYRTMIYPNTTYDFLSGTIIRLSELGVEVFTTPNLECTMKFLHTFYDQRTKPEADHTLFKKIRALTMPTKLTSNPAVPRLMALCPRIPEKVATKLIYKHGSIWGVLHASDAQLRETEGMGATLIRRLKESIGKE